MNISEKRNMPSVYLGGPDYQTKQDQQQRIFVSQIMCIVH